MARSRVVGEVRETITELVVASMTRGATAPTMPPTPTAMPMPVRAIPLHRSALRGQPIVRARAAPMSDTINGATSMAPITTAVDSTTTPTEAMTLANPIRAQNRAKRTGATGPSKKTFSWRLRRSSASTGRRRIQLHRARASPGPASSPSSLNTCTSPVAPTSTATAAVPNSRKTAG